jgi:16S rRNA (guanine(966)-N(2))-methyltransferase RsmD
MRVIAGSARGRKLQAPASEQTRPTADLVKGAIFSMLEAEAYKRGYGPGDEGEFASAAAWPRVLDLFAGSGALAIEALSRGAASADLVEASVEARQVIQRNLKRTGLDSRARVHTLSAAQALARFREAGVRFDLVLLDPPYAFPGLEEISLGVIRSRLVGPSSVLVVEHARDSTLPPRLDEYMLLRQKLHGRTAISLFGAQPGSQAERDR